MKKLMITVGGFDEMDSKKVRFIHKASKLGQLDVILFEEQYYNKPEETPVGSATEVIRRLARGVIVAHQIINKLVSGSTD